jgi:AsmA protein
MTRTLVLSGVLVTLLAAAFGFHVRLDQDAASERLSRSLAGGEAVVRVGAAGLRLLPVPHVAMKAVNVTSSDGRHVLRAPAARASIELLPLLAGRVSFTDIRIDRGVIAADLPDTASTAPDTILKTLSGLGEFPTRLSVTETTLTLTRAGTTLLDLTGLNATTRRRDAQGRRQMIARFRLGDQEVSIDALVPSPQQNAGGIWAGFRIDARSPSFTLRANLPIERQSGGEIAVSSTNVAQTLAWLGQTSPLARVFDRIELQGRLSRQTASWDIDNARLKLDGQELEGALSWDFSRDKPILAGTLAGSGFDLGRLVTRLAGARLDRPDMIDWGFDPVDAPPMPSPSGARMHDLDLRLSLEKATIGTLNLDEAAAQVLFSPARIDLNLVQAKLHKGAVKARYTVTRATIGGEQRVQVGFDKIDLAALSQDLIASRRLSGTGTGQLLLEGGGTTLKGLVRSAHGKATLSIRQGEVQGFALADTLRRLERQPLIALRDWRTGRSTFDQAQLTGTITQGLLELTEGAVTAPGFVLTLGGQVSLADQALGLKGLLAHPAGRGLQVPFEITGPWEQPAITPRLDPAVFQRTGTTAPAR